MDPQDLRLLPIRWLVPEQQISRSIRVSSLKKWARMNAFQALIRIVCVGWMIEIQHLDSGEPEEYGWLKEVTNWTPNGVTGDIVTGKAEALRLRHDHVHSTWGYWVRPQSHKDGCGRRSLGPTPYS
jgi:hypothetical protein